MAFIAYHDNVSDHTWTTFVETKVPAEALLSNDIKELIDLVVVRVICPVLEICGIVTNVLNLLIFAKLGLTDSVSVTFFALSFSDLILLIAALFNWTCSTMAVFPVSWLVHPFHLSYLVIWFYQMILDISILTVTYISIQRCACVALPFKFKGAFTKTRTLIALTGIYSFGIACYTPMFLNQGLTTVTNSLTNSTWLVLYFTERRDQVLAVIDVLNRITLPAVTQIVVLICMTVLVNSLNASGNFRKSSVMPTKNKHKKTILPGKSESSSINRTTKDRKSMSSNGQLNNKELQVIKVVTFVSIQFVVCNTPSVIIAFFRRFMPDFNLYKPQHNLYMTMNVFKNLCEFIGATFNFLIYLKFNTRFRELFLSMSANFSSFKKCSTEINYATHACPRILSPACEL